MRRILIGTAAAALFVGLHGSAALAMQPQGNGAEGKFGCVDGESNPVGGHPGSYNSPDGVGLDATTVRLDEAGHDHPTAWNAAFRTGDGPNDGPIILGHC